MFDLLADLLVLLLAAPCTVALVPLGMIAGWKLGGQIGLFIGAAIGVALGAWLDLSSSTLATRARWPVAAGALFVLAAALFR